MNRFFKKISLYIIFIYISAAGFAVHGALYDPLKSPYPISLEEFTEHVGRLSDVVQGEVLSADPESFLLPDSLKSLDQMYAHLLKHYLPVWPHLDGPGWWNWLVDSARTSEQQKLGPQLYEGNEKNYLKGMAQGFAYMLSTLKEPLTTKMIVAFHDLAVAGVERTEFHGLAPERFFRKGLTRSKSFQWGYVMELFTKNVETPVCGVPIYGELDRDGLGDFVNFNRELFLSLRENNELVTTHLAELMGYFLEKYEEEVKAAGGDEYKTKKAMGRLIRRMVTAHFFPDGNGRAFVFLLLNRLLLERGYAPAVMEGSASFNVETFFLEDFGQARENVDWQIEAFVERINSGQSTYQKLIVGEEMREAETPPGLQESDD